jgi:hypothetical protein
MLPAVDLANVNWLYVAVLAVLVFFSTLIGMLLSFKRVFRSAWLSALLFAAAFVYWKLLSARLAAADNDHHPECVGPGRNR